MKQAFSDTEPRDEFRQNSYTRYEEDPHAWAFEQAASLRAGRFADLDLANLAGEIEDLGRHEYDKLEIDLARVIQHLLKWDFQPARRSRSWVSTIREHRRRVDRHLQDNPSLKNRRAEALQQAFERGRADALIETDLPDDVFPAENRDSWDEVMTRSVAWPEP